MTSSDRAGSVPTGEPLATLASVSLDCPDPSALADFYGALLGMRRVFETPDGGLVSLTNGTINITMMRTADYVAPTWPVPGQLQQMHLDLSVAELEPAVAQAIALGATPAAFQAAPDHWRVLIDPAGHPFCLTTITI